jgi:hypothetical protein
LNLLEVIGFNCNFLIANITKIHLKFHDFLLAQRIVAMKY